MENLRLGDWVMILIYSVLMIVIGFYCIRYARKGVSYFAGGRKIPWWLSGISSWMSAFSAYVFVGLASVIYEVGAAPLYHILYAMSFAWFAGALLWAERWRKTGIITVPEYMEKRFNLATRQVFAWVVTPFRIADDGVKCYATAKIIAFVFGIPSWLSIIGLSLVTILYTMIGGLWAVMITDMVQFVILILVIFVVLPVGLAKVGWLSGLTAGAPEHFFRIFQAPQSFNGDFTVWFFVAMWIMHPFLYNGSFSLVQRYTTVPTPRDARKSAWLSMWLGLIFFPLILGPPLISRILYGDLLMGSKALMETSYIKLCVDLLPVGMIGVVVVALMAATMSSLAGDYNIYGAVLTNDLYHRLLNPKASQRRLAVVGRFNTLIVGALALVVALGVESMGGAFAVMMTILGMIGGPTTIPILLGLWIRRPSPAAAIAACTCGVAFGALAKWVWGFSYAPFVLGNIAVTAVVFLAWGWLFPARGKLKEKIDLLFDRVLKGPESLGAGPAADEEDTDKVPSPFTIVGVILGVIGLALGLVGILAGSSASAVKIDGIVSLVLLVLGAVLVRSGRLIARGK
ncbi:MAG TPA: sodium/solute symporter [archaeon]|nr:sodium/solute symporter [archaeon]